MNPFRGKSATSTIANILKQTPPPLTERNPVAPPELDRIVRKCLRKRREERYQSARELLVDLSNLRRDLAAPPPETAPAVSHPLTLPATGPAAGVFSRGTARFLFVLIQAGYLVMYAALYLKMDEASRFLQLMAPGENSPVSRTIFGLFVVIFFGLPAFVGSGRRLPTHRSEF